MNNYYVRVTVFIIVILMISSLFLIGCSKPVIENEKIQDDVSTDPVEESDSEKDVISDSKDYDEIVELEYMHLNPAWDPPVWLDDPVTTQITDRTGIKLNCIVPSGEGEQIANVMLLSDDYPEIISGFSTSMYAKYVAAGALYSIDELVEEYNYPHVLDGTTLPLASQAVHRSEDGKLYGVPGWFSEDGFGSVGQSLTVRNDIYKELGEPEIKSMDDFYQLLIDVRDKDMEYNGVEMWPLSVAWATDSAILGDIANIWGNKIYSYYYHNEDTNRVEFFLRAPEVVKAVEFLNKGYNDRLIDPECFTFDSTQMEEAWAQGKYVFNFSWFWNHWTADALMKQEDPERYYKAIELPQGTPGEKPYFGYIHTAGDLGFCVTKNCKDPEAAIRFIDYMLSDEGEILDFYGVEGNTMVFNEEGQPEFMEGVYEAKLADWKGYGRETGVRLLDLMQNQKWNWERHVEEPVRAANRAMASKSAFDATYLKPIQVDSSTPEGILYADIEANIRAQITEIIVDTDITNVESEIMELLSYYEEKGLSTLEDAWTNQYQRIISNIE